MQNIQTFYGGPVIFLVTCDLFNSEVKFTPCEILKFSDKLFWKNLIF